jgi:RimJ/RimL family protein N-acetyltransferase
MASDDPRFPLSPPLPPAVLARVRDTPLKPEPVTLPGRFVVLEPYSSAAHIPSLWAGLNGGPYLGHPAYDHEALVWRYIWGAPATEEALAARLNKHRDAPDARMWTVRLRQGVPLAAAVAAAAGADAGSPRSDVASPSSPSSPSSSPPTFGPPGPVVGIIGLIANRPENLCAEVAFVVTTPALQATPATTEAAFLLLGHCFDSLAYRRVEWKTNTQNARSRRAAERLGFVFEGVFRRHFLVQEGRSRDTAWFSMIGPDYWGWDKGEEEEGGEGGEGRKEGAKASLAAFIASPKAVELFARRAKELEGGA